MHINRRAGSVFLAMAMLTSFVAMPAPIAVGQATGTSVTTDRSQYSVGDTAQICYTVAGPGPFSITDKLADGSSQIFTAADDDGTGDCLTGIVTPPAGTECLTIIATSAGESTSSQTCFQVLAQGSVTPPPAGQDCGTVSVLGGHTTSSGAQAIESCFYQAFQGCAPASLEVTISAVDAGTRHAFSLQSDGGGCTITDAIQHFVVPRPPQPAMTTTCSRLSQTADGGLLFSSCGGEDVTVPPS